MAESRKCQVVLLDDRKLKFNVQPKMLACDLFDIVASHFQLKEKEYFGLFFLDDSGNQTWFQMDRKVLEHDLPRKSEIVVFYFAVRFYIENICYLHDSVSVELYYLQVRQSIYKGIIECDSLTVFELAAYALQISYENLTDETAARDAVKRLSVFPTSTLREHPSIQFCEDQVLKLYYSMNGISRGQAIISYMSIAEKLPTFGIHYYEVKNKQGIPWWLGLSFKGIAQYDYKDKKTPRRVFPWKHLENLYFRDKKFSIEVHDPKRIVHTLSSFNLYEDAIREPAHECDDLSDAISDPTTQVSVSRRTFGPSNVSVYAWFTSKPQLTKCIWSMAVCQHQFFLDRLQNKTSMMVKRCPNSMAEELSRSTTSLQSLHSLNSRSNLLQESALNSLGIDQSKKLQRASRAKLELTPELKASQLELYNRMDERKKSLENILREKIKDLKEVCIKESEITGELPHEYAQFMTPGEKIPTIKRRIGTAFSIADLVDGTGPQDVLSKLEMEYEVQKQITKAKQRLAHDETLAKAVRKKHKADYLEAHAKLKDLETNIKTAMKTAGLDAASFTSTSEELSEIGSIISDDNISLGGSPSLTKSPSKKSSAQQLEALEHSPLSRRRFPSGSRLSTKNSSRSLNTMSSNPSSSASLASLSQLEGYHDFTPTKALKFKSQFTSPSNPISTVHSSADLDSVGSSTANSSASSLHAYSVSGGRPLRSGSMDDVRVAMNGGDSSTPSPQHQRDLPEGMRSNAMSQRSKNYLANNPYGSLERKTLRKHRAVRQGGGMMFSHPEPPSNIYNPYNNVGDNSYIHPPSYRAPPDYRRQNEMPPVTQPRMPAHPGYRRITQSMDRDYTHHVQQASKKMYETSQPFQMLDNPYNTHKKNLQLIGNNNNSDAHIAPIAIDPKRDYYTDSSSSASSPKECAFDFFNNLNAMVDQRLPNNCYRHPLTEDRPKFKIGAEESKPFVMDDYYMYSERLRRARGESISSNPPEPVKPPSRSRTPSSSGRSLDGSRPASPYTVFQNLNGNRGSPSLASHPEGQPTPPPNYAMTHSFSSGHIRPQGSIPRRSVSMNQVKDSSFNTGDVANDFSQEMLAWYQDQEPDQSSSTLV